MSPALRLPILLALLAAAAIAIAGCSADRAETSPEQSAEATTTSREQDEDAGAAQEPQQASSPGFNARQIYSGASRGIVTVVSVFGER